MSGTILFRLYEPGDRQGLLDLFDAVYGHEAPARTSAWRYLDRPGDVARIAVAEADGRIVGAQPSHEIDLRVRDEPVRGALLLDVMTHPGYRRRGVFAGVVDTVRRASLERGVQILMTTPNGDAAHGFERLQAWRCLGEMIPLVAPISLLSLFTGGLRPRGSTSAPKAGASALRARSDPGAGDAPRVEQVSRLDRPLDDLCRRFSGLAPCMASRSESFLRWRFSEQAARGYEFFLLAGDAACDGLAVTTRSRLAGKEVLLLADLMLPGPRRERRNALLCAVKERAGEAGVAAVVTYVSPGSPLLSLLSSNGFRAVPRWLRPRAYTVWLSGGLDRERWTLAIDFASWHLSLADSDLA
jgi:GNAT superfamily N-acetyltransferase